MLTDAAIKRAKAGEKEQKLWDSGGLHLHISTSGHKSFRLKYRFAGKEKLLTLGAYPDELTLLQARDARDAAKRELRDGKDPAVEKRRRKIIANADATTTFYAFAERWHDLNAPRWADIYADNVWRGLERDVLPTLGKLPISTIDVPMILSVLEPIERRGALETASRIRQQLEMIFALAISRGATDKNPAITVKGALTKSKKKSRHPAITDLDQLRALLKKVEEETNASPITRLANRLLALTAVRPGVLTGTPWEAGEFEGLQGIEPLWRIPPQRMKLRKERKDDEAFEHLVPLSGHAVDVINAIRSLTGHMKFVFPNERWADRPMTENAINAMLKRAGALG